MQSIKVHKCNYIFHLLSDHVEYHQVLSGSEASPTASVKFSPYRTHHHFECSQTHELSEQGRNRAHNYIVKYDLKCSDLVMLQNKLLFL